MLVVWHGLFSLLDESLTVAEAWVTGVPDRVPEKLNASTTMVIVRPEDYQRPVGNEDIGDRAAHHIAPGVGGGMPTPESPGTPQ